MAKLKIISNESIARDYYKIRLECNEKKDFKPGQFVNLSVGTDNGLLLKRPISINDINGNIITLIYEIKGKGTYALSKIKSGQLDALYFLGNGFNITDLDKKIMLIAGGMGVAPLYSVLTHFPDRQFYSYLGFRDKDKIICYDDFYKYSEKIELVTEDGSRGKKGFVTDFAIQDIERIKPNVILSCGPKPMLSALRNIKDYRVEVSLEERMGCGFGACLVCSIKTKNGMKRVCKDGPVFNIKELFL